jgi:hypothetical protein
MVENLAKLLKDFRKAIFIASIDKGYNDQEQSSERDRDDESKTSETRVEF